MPRARPNLWLAPELNRERSLALRNQQKPTGNRYPSCRPECTKFLPGSENFMSDAVVSGARGCAVSRRELASDKKWQKKLSGRKNTRRKQRQQPVSGRGDAPDAYQRKNVSKFACRTERKQPEEFVRRVNIDSYCLCDQTKRNEPMRKTIEEEIAAISRATRGDDESLADPKHAGRQRVESSRNERIDDPTVYGGS
ncbi:hypothetical protein Aduo_008781 [Ancylostoma duodenale]